MLDGGWCLMLGGGGLDKVKEGEIGLISCQYKKFGAPKKALN